MAIVYFFALSLKYVVNVAYLENKMKYMKVVKKASKEIGLDFD